MFDKIKTLQGSPNPLGFSIQADKANFSLYSHGATQVFIAFFSEKSPLQPAREFPLQREGDIWHIALSGLPKGAIYSFRCEGPYAEISGDLFCPSIWLSDPYGKSFDTPTEWGERSEIGGHTRGKWIDRRAFPWEGDRPLKIPLNDLVIYELHVRGFTIDPSARVSHPGTYLGIIEKIPHLKKLGINAVELMPIFEFDETHCKNINPKTGLPFLNYWGYNPLHFFAPMRRYASGKEDRSPGDEFKMAVRELHRAGIEVILDVVYNHTGEGKEKDYFINFRGIDNRTYYLVDEEGHYRDNTGCGNTLNANCPIVLRLILDSLRYWIEEMHVDGFRFDLASTLTRGEDGAVLENPPILTALLSDPVISQVKLIAESWDAGGLYQVGSFPKWGPWSEWNDLYRDTVRRFLKGTKGQAGSFANVFCGSEFLYSSSKTPLSSINFITAHDGFTLRDLVSYNEKHNENNGEANKDGSTQNESWNCGWEGFCPDPKVNELRERQMRNFFLTLFLSQGIPMLLMGDEYGHTRHGNNNPYVQDNELNWFLWDELKKNQKICSFVSSLIAFRKTHPILRQSHFLTASEIDWHGELPFEPHWDESSQFVACTLKGKTPLYVAFNGSEKNVTIALPEKVQWKQIVSTAEGWDQHHLLDPENGAKLPSTIHLTSHSALLSAG